MDPPLPPAGDDDGGKDPLRMGIQVLSSRRISSANLQLRLIFLFYSMDRDAGFIRIGSLLAVALQATVLPDFACADQTPPAPLTNGVAVQSSDGSSVHPLTSAGTLTFTFQSAPIAAANGFSPEPQAGQWPTWVLDPAHPLSVPPPPAPNSLEEKQELNELKRLMSQRTPQSLAQARYWATGPASFRWNEKELEFITKYKETPPRVSRGLALLNTAIEDAVVEAWKQKYTYPRRRPAQADSSITEAVEPGPDPCYPSEHAVVAGVSSRILAYLYPSERQNLESMAQEAAMSRVLSGVDYPSDIEQGLALGRAAADLFIQRAMNDHAGASIDQWNPQNRPTGPAYWEPTVTDNIHVQIVVPTEPLWGRVQPWLMAAGDQFRPHPPPRYGSLVFEREAKEVEEAGNHLTADQQHAAVFWSDSVGTLTPPGHWTETALDLIRRYHLDTPQAARVLALLSAAQADAFIACWDAKYTYWSVRPITAIQRRNPTWKPYLTTPPFPSYVSGHSTVSMAAAEVLFYFFPKEERDLRKQALEASNSRLYAGIHYRSDLNGGRALGKKIAELAIAKDKSRISPASNQ